MEGYYIMNGMGIIPADTTVIEEGDFEDCTELTSIVIPGFVTEVEDGAFRGCVNLRSIKVDPSNGVYDSREDCNAIIETETNSLVVGCAKTKIPQGVEVIDDYAFYGCKGLKSIEIPATVERIGDCAFYGCKGLKSIEIPASVERVGDGAFQCCFGLENIVIPASVTEIGEDAFDECNNLRSIKVSPDNKVYDSREDCNALIETASNTLLRGCPTSTIPEGVTTIGRGAFFECGGLRNIEIPASVGVIENYAFSESGIEQLELPPSVEGIGESAFQGCTKLKSLVIPASVRVIGDGAFFECHKLESVEILSSEVEIGDGAFEDCPALKTVKMPYVTEYHGWFVDSVNLTNVEMPSVEVIGDNAFAGQKKLKKLVFTDLLEVGEEAFKGCTGLTSVIMPKVEEIGICAFEDCTGLKEIEMSSVEKVGECAFAGCTALKSVELPSLKWIGNEAFGGCSALKSVKVSSNGEEISGSPFACCENLTSFELLTAEHGDELDDYGLLDIGMNLKEIIVPAGTGKHFKKRAKDMMMDRIIVERKEREPEKKKRKVATDKAKAREKKKKENTKESAKGFITIGFKSIVSGDMDFLRDDLDEDPDNPYLNWVLEKTTESNTLTFECPVKLVNELLEKNNPCNYISRWELEEFGKNVGEEAYVDPLIARCDEIAVETNARAVQQDWALGRSWRDDGVDLEGEERTRWKELLLKNINNGLAKNFFTLEEFKKDLEDCPDEEKPKDESEWENEYSKYIDCRVDDYYEEMDDYKDKQKHMEGSGLKTWDEKNMWSLEKCRDWLYDLGDDSSYEWYVDSFWLEDEKGNRIKEQTQN